MKIHHSLFFLAGMAVASTASAQSTETSGNIAFSLPDLAGSSESTVISLPKFDTSLGTLTNVALTLNSTINGYAVVINLSNGTGSFSNASADFTQAGDFITLTGPDGLTSTANPIVSGFSGTVGPGFGVQKFSNPVSTTMPTINVADPNLSLYEALGGGQLSSQLSLSAVATSAVSGSQVGVGASASASGDMSVTYTYTAIPEPSTYAAILGVCALAYAMAQTKRRMA